MGKYLANLVTQNQKINPICFIRDSLRVFFLPICGARVKFLFERTHLLYFIGTLKLLFLIGKEEE
jgi:hypothetical protein